MLSALITLVVVGFFAYLIDRFVPMIDIIRVVFRFVVVVLVIVWLAGVFGIVKVPVYLKF